MLGLLEFLKNAAKFGLKMAAQGCKESHVT